MQITAIKTANFLVARDVDVKLAKPICLVAGKNGTGKSSLQEAVRHALTGESVRVSLKKDYRKLVTEGADVGFCVVEHDDQVILRFSTAQNFRPYEVQRLQRSG